MKLKLLGKTAEDFGIQLEDISNYYDGTNWTNKNEYPEDTQQKINKIFDDIYSKYPSRIILSFRNEYQTLSNKARDLRRLLGYGEDIVTFFSDFGFHYDMGPIAQSLAKLQTPITEEVLEPDGVALTPIEEVYKDGNWISLSGKTFDKNQQSRLNHVMNQVYGWYPTRMIVLLNKNHKKFTEETLLKARRLCEYEDNESFFSDFGFNYVNKNAVLAKKKDIYSEFVATIPRLASLKNISIFSDYLDSEVLDAFLVTKDELNTIKDISSKNNETLENILASSLKIRTVTETNLMGIKLFKDEESVNKNEFVIDNDGVLVKYQGNEESIVIPMDVKTIKKNSFSKNNIKHVSFESGSCVNLLKNAFENLKNATIDFTNCEKVSAIKGSLPVNGSNKYVIKQNVEFERGCFEGANESNYLALINDIGLVQNEDLPIYGIIGAVYEKNKLGYRKLYISKVNYAFGDIVECEGKQIIVTGTIKPNDYNCVILPSVKPIDIDIETALMNMAYKLEEVNNNDSIGEEEVNYLLSYLTDIDDEESGLNPTTQCQTIDIDLWNKMVFRNRYRYRFKLLEPQLNVTLFDAIIGLNNNIFFDAYPQYFDNMLFLKTLFINCKPNFQEIVDLYKEFFENDKLLVYLDKNDYFSPYHYKDQLSENRINKLAKLGMSKNTISILRSVDYED